MEDLDQLELFPFSGHGSIMGVYEHTWQNSGKVLLYFHQQIKTARNEYKRFVGKGIIKGKRRELTGGGLIRSIGGWTEVREQQTNAHIKSDERILGDGDFVAEILSKSDERLEKCYKLRSKGVDINYIAQRVSELLDLPPEEIWKRGKYKRLVHARSLLCFWAVRELGISMASMGRRLSISTVAVSKSVARGAEIAKKERFELI